MATTQTPSLLIIGGSGFVSGTLAREAISQGWRVHAVTRGTRALPAGVTPIVADRKKPGELEKAMQSVAGEFDLVADCIPFEPADLKQDIALFRDRAKQFVMISTDFVYDPARRRFPQPEADAHYLQDQGYGANKRRCELELINAPAGVASAMQWTIFRPCHIYGPGSQLGCSPPTNRDAALIEKIRSGKPLPLVGAHLLQQPIFAPDLAKLILSVRGNPRAVGQVFNACGPDIIESWMYYKLIADTLGVAFKYEDQIVEPYLAANPDKAPFLCHRIYDLTRLRASGLAVPSTPAAEAIKTHVKSLLPA